MVETVGDSSPKIVVDRYHLNILGEVVGRTINVRTHLSYKLKNDA